MHLTQWHVKTSVTSGMIYRGVKTRCSLLSVCCRFLLQRGHVWKRATLMSKSICEDQDSSKQRNSLRRLCWVSPTARGTCGPAIRVTEGAKLPAAVPHAISNKRAGMSETKLLCKLVIKLLKCCLECKRVSEVQRSTMSCMRTLQRGCRCLLRWELVADVPFIGMLSLNTVLPCSISVILKSSSP